MRVLLAYNDVVGRRLAAELGIAVAAPPSQRGEAVAAFDTAVLLGADVLDLPPRKVRAAFVQLIMQLRGAGTTIDELAVMLGRP